MAEAVQYIAWLDVTHSSDSTRAVLGAGGSSRPLRERIKVRDLEAHAPVLALASLVASHHIASNISGAHLCKRLLLSVHGRVSFTLHHIAFLTAARTPFICSSFQTLSLSGHSLVFLPYYRLSLAMDSLCLPTYREGHSRRYHPYPCPPRSRGIQVTDRLVRHLNYHPPISSVLRLIVIEILFPHQSRSALQDEGLLSDEVGEILSSRDENGRKPGERHPFCSRDSNVPFALVFDQSRYDTREIRSDTAQHGSQNDVTNLERALGLEPGQQHHGFIAVVLELAAAVRSAINWPAVVLKKFFSPNDDVLVLWVLVDASAKGSSEVQTETHAPRRVAITPGGRYLVMSCSNSILPSQSQVTTLPKECLRSSANLFAPTRSCCTLLTAISITTRTHSGLQSMSLSLRLRAIALCPRTGLSRAAACPGLLPRACGVRRAPAGVRLFSLHSVWRSVPPPPDNLKKGKQSEDEPTPAEKAPTIRENIYTIPNLLTLSRIAACPVLGWSIVNNDFYLATGILVYAGLTDLVDGFLARRFNMRSVLGTILDPAADKMLMTTLTVTLAMKDLLPVPLAVIILGRDVLLSLAAFYIRYTTLPPPVGAISIPELLSRDRFAQKTFTRYWDFSIPSAEVHPTGISKVNTALQLLLMGTTTIGPILPFDIAVSLHALQYVYARLVAEYTLTLEY
ncbi:hypothetical protein NUW54_g7450 [Trametes sanguinea]|uniref:Uncharacterized protein n=1 Tax=Trametes sanguinea TaxID=158606 RepID=A0ACC1PLG9_9APHY|nr:hypothetical protein NUW54_g7450 [Trametes sanguinea]